VNRAAIIAWLISFAGMALWLYGYFATGNPSLIDWRADTPWWIADFLPNLESEIGLVLVCVGTVLSYWPARR
jgi:protein-S-isoprenylcysteine O-methyltransferase Ste14